MLHGALLQVRHRRCVLLTGTPLQNNLQELWSLLAFILPKVSEPRARSRTQPLAIHGVSDPTPA